MSLLCIGTIILTIPSLPTDKTSSLIGESRVISFKWAIFSCTQRFRGPISR